MLIGLAGCESHEQKVERCVSKGIEYFKSINRYPRLSNGQLAEEIARRQCSQSVNAY